MLQRTPPQLCICPKHKPPHHCQPRCSLRLPHSPQACRSRCLIPLCLSAMGRRCKCLTPGHYQSCICRSHKVCMQQTMPQLTYTAQQRKPSHHFQPRCIQLWPSSQSTATTVPHCESRQDTPSTSARRHRSPRCNHSCGLQGQCGCKWMNWSSRLHHGCKD